MIRRVYVAVASFFYAMICIFTNLLAVFYGVPAVYERDRYGSL